METESPPEASDDHPTDQPPADKTVEEPLDMTSETDDTETTPQTTTGGHPSIPVERLSKSYRFDAELAAILTRLQYRADGITLTAADDRPVPTVSAPTDGVQAVFDADASLVFVCYDDRGCRTVNPVETALIETLATTVAGHHNTADDQHRSDGGATAGPLAEGPPESDPVVDTASGPEQTDSTPDTDAQTQPSVGVVTPHNAQRGALTQVLPAAHTANTVEKYQGGERDVMVVSGTVSDPEFARREEQFLLNPRRILVAISRARLLTVVVCSSALFEVAPEDSDRLEEGPVWARLFAQTVGRNETAAWSGSLDDFTGDDEDEHATVPVQVYPSTVGGNDR